jgi:hypothetical protein
MNYITEIVQDPNVRLETFAADLTSAVYSVMLRSGLRDSWLKAELGLWKALEDTVKEWARRRPPTEATHALKAWRAGLQIDLTASAFNVALTNGITDSLLELELCLYRAIRLVTRRYRRVKQSK